MCSVLTKHIYSVYSARPPLAITTFGSAPADEKGEPNIISISCALKSNLTSK